MRGADSSSGSQDYDVSFASFKSFNSLKSVDEGKGALYKKIEDGTVSYFKASNFAESFFFSIRYKKADQVDTEKIRTFIKGKEDPRIAKIVQISLGEGSYKILEKAKFSLEGAGRFREKISTPSITGQKSELLKDARDYFDLLRYREAEKIGIVSSEKIEGEDQIIDLIEGQSSFKDIDVKGIQNKIENKEELSNEELGAIIEAKNRRLQIANIAGSVVDVHIIAKHPHYQGLSNVLSLSEFNTEQIDDALLKQHVEEHKVNRLEKSVFVVGAGPSGLMTSLKLYLKGYNVHLVNNRGEILKRNDREYNLNQIVRLDPKWVAELQLYLGNDFEKAIDQGYAVMKDSGYVEIPIDQIVGMMKTRLVKIQSLDTENDLAIEFESEVKGVKEGKIQVGEKEEEKIVATHDFDALVFASGANDKLRNNFLSSELTTRRPRPYTVSVYTLRANEKEAVTANRERLLESSRREDFAIPQVLLNWQISEYIKSLKNEEATELYKSLFIDLKGPQGYSFVCRFFENVNQFYVGVQGGNFPQVIKKRNELEEEIRVLEASSSKSQKDKEELSTLKEKLDKLNKNAFEMDRVIAPLVTETLAKLRGVAIEKYEKDENNASTFMVQQKAVTNAATITPEGKCITAVGDSLASPHFFSGSGLSSAREEINNVAHAMAKPITGDIESQTRLAELNSAQERIIYFTIGKGQNFEGPPPSRY